MPVAPIAIPPVELNHMENVGQKALVGSPPGRKRFLINCQKMLVGNDCQFYLRGAISAARYNFCYLYSGKISQY